MSKSSDEALVRDALAKVGERVESVWDLVNTDRPYPLAVPVLIDLLPRVSDDKIKEGIVRSLMVKESRRVAARPLVEELKRLDPAKQGLGWAIGSALADLADAEVGADLEEIMRDRRRGRARQMIAFALVRAKSPNAADVLLEVLDDPSVTGHAIAALGKLRAQKARRRIEPYLAHSNGWIRREAKQALKRIDQAGGETSA